MNRRQLHYVILLNRRQLHYIILLCRLETVHFPQLSLVFFVRSKSFILIFSVCGTKRDEFAVKGRTFGHSQTRGQASCQFKFRVNM